MSRSERRFRAVRATARNHRIKADKRGGSPTGPDALAPVVVHLTPVDEGRAGIGYGRPRPRKARSDEQRSAWGIKPTTPRHRAIADHLA